MWAVIPNWLGKKSLQRLRCPNFLARRLLLSCVAEPDFCLDPEATFFLNLIFKAINKTFENKDENILSRELELMPKGFKKKNRSRSSRPSRPGSGSATVGLMFCCFQHNFTLSSSFIDRVPTRPYSKTLRLTGVGGHPSRCQLTCRLLPASSSSRRSRGCGQHHHRHQRRSSSETLYSSSK